MSKRGRVVIAPNLKKEKAIINQYGEFVDITDFGRGGYKQGQEKLKAGEGERQNLQ